MERRGFTPEELLGFICNNEKVCDDVDLSDTINSWFGRWTSRDVMKTDEAVLLVLRSAMHEVRRRESKSDGPLGTLYLNKLIIRITDESNMAGRPDLAIDGLKHLGPLLGFSPARRCWR